MVIVAALGVSAQFFPFGVDTGCSGTCTYLLSLIRDKVYESPHPIGLRKHNEQRFTSLYLFKINEPKQQLY